MPIQDIAQPVVRLGEEGDAIDFGGSRIVFKSPAEGAGDAWTVVDYTMAAGQPGRPIIVQDCRDAGGKLQAKRAKHGVG